MAEPGKIGKFLEEVVMQTLGRAIVEGVGESARDKAKTLTAHFFGLTETDEAGLMDAEERAIAELREVNTDSAVEAMVAKYRDWLVQRTPPKGREDTIPGLDIETAREIAWRARKWAIYVTTHQDAAAQTRVVKGLMEAQGDDDTDNPRDPNGFHAKDMRLLAAIREVPFTMRIEKWCKDKLASFRGHLNPEIRARIYHRVGAAARTAVQRIGQFMNETVAPAIANGAERSRQVGQTWRESRASHSLLGNLFTGRRRR